MRQDFYIAWRYLAYYKARTATLVACVTVIAFLPLALEVLRQASERQLMARAVATPLVVGARGSAMDLVMNSLYYTRQLPELVSMQLVDEVERSDLVTAIPLYVRFTARGQPIVATEIDYFEYRGLEYAAGRSFALLGECVLGAEAARILGLTEGDSLVTSPETVFDLTGVYPLEMSVVGVLAPHHSADDRAVFVDVKTAWLIQGLVHGHQDLSATRDPTLVMRRSDDVVVATPKLYQFNKVTSENTDSFHFHGDPGDYPLSAVLAVPENERAAALFRGHYLEGDSPHHVVRPRDIIGELLENIFRVKRLLQGVMGVVGGATLLALVLVFALSLRLRQRELQTLFKLGAARGTVTRLVLAEIVTIAAAAAALCGMFLWLVSRDSDMLLRTLVLAQ
jgi:putative ABC transport system permease protein